MAITISGSVTIQDKKGQQHVVKTDEIPFDESDTQQAQGNCRTHEGSWEEDDWSVTISVEEYPEGACNGHQISVENCSVVQDNVQCRNGAEEEM